jgi:hypothetical protein
MTYAVLTDHPEALHDGRMVESGAQLSDSDAEKNPHLIERRVLVKEAERPKPRHKTEPEHKPEHDAAAAPQEEESK